MIIHNHRLDMVPDGPRLIVRVNQYDEDFTIRLKLYAREGDFTVESGTTAAIRGTKPDGNGFSADCELTTELDEEENEIPVVVVTGDQQMTVVAGQGEFEITLYKGEDELNTANFTLSIERAALDKDTVVSKSQTRELVEIEDNAEELIAAAQTMADAQEAFERLTQESAENAQSASDSAAAAEQALADIRNEYDTENAELDAKITAANEQIDEKGAAIAALVTKADETAAEALTKVNNYENHLADVDADLQKLGNSVQSLETSRDIHVANLINMNGVLYGVNENGDIVTDAIDGLNGGGGGGGSSATSTVTITNTSGFNAKTIAAGGSAEVSFTWSSVESEMPTGNGTLKITVNNVLKSTQEIQQGNVTLDVAPYLSTGANSVRLTVVDSYENSRFTALNITVVDLSISSTFDATTQYQGPISFSYIPVGAVQKTISILVDDRVITTDITSVSGSQRSVTIPQQTHGAHKIECYATAEINGQLVESNHLYYEVICVEPLNTTPIIVSSYSRTTAAQYETLNIGYSVYDPKGLTANVTISVNGETVSEVTVDRTQQVFTYRADNYGPLNIVIASGTASKTITMTVSESDVHVEAETDQLALYLTSAGRSSNENNPWTWVYEKDGKTISATMTRFNGAQNGWMNDSDGNTVLRVMGGALVTIPFQAFATDPRVTGLTFEMEFATHNVLDYDAMVLSCMSGGRGIQLTAQQATFQAENSGATAQYNENEHVRLSIVVEKRTETRLIQLYLNGELSRTVQYDEMEDFTQPSPVGITIGSVNCGVDIYNIRIYNNNLTRYQIRDNWIADTQDVGLMLERYRKNDVYDEYGRIVISKLPGDLPYMIIECEELPQYKGDKKTATIHYVDPVNGVQSFEAELVQIDVQGTSSQFYAVKNIKAKFKNGLVVNGTTKTGYALREGAIEVDTFTLKADVASSEGANNVILVRLYEILAREIGALTPPQKINSKVQQGIDGLPMVVFWRDTVTDTTSFVGKYNFNNDKGTENLFGFSNGDESWEVKDDESLLTKFKTNVFGEKWYAEDVEARYPEDNQDNTHLSEMVNWVYSTWQENATGNALAETYTDVDGNTHTVDNAAYRLAKFKTEFEDHFDLKSATLYYLFTLHFLMANSRQKNMFPTYWAAIRKWMFLIYDADTGLGSDNRGTLAYKYSLEDIDMLGDRMVFDGQDVVLWVNFRQAFWPEVVAMYQQLRSSGKFNYEYVEAMFEEHQGKWPVSIFNEDAFYKYINPLIKDGNTSYLNMAQGSKTLQRRFWLANRFDYMDSLMVSGNARTNWINIRPIYTVTEAERAAGAVDLHITPYADIYVTVDFDSRRRQIRANRETTVTVENPATMMSFGNVVAIYSADKIADVGDLSPLKLSYADFSAATRLQRIKVGDASASYENTNLQELSVGTNPLLKVLDARNCSALGTGATSILDASGCTNVEEIYVSGTALAGVSVPNGGVLRIFHLSEKPSTLIIRNQPNLVELIVPDYSGITTLWLDNIGTIIDEKAILAQIQAGARVRMTGIYWEVTGATEISQIFDLLDTMRGLDENGNNTEKAQVSGTIHTSALTGAEIAAFNARYPYIKVVADHVTSYLTYKSYDDSSTIKTVTCLDGVPQEAAPAIPARSQTAQYTYTAVGWNTMQDAQAAEYPIAGPTTGMQADTTLYAAYSRTVRTYTVTWKNSDGTVLETDNNVPYGSTPQYNGSTPQNPTSGGGAFQGWTPAVSNVTGNVTYTASYIKTYTVYFYNGNTLLQTVTGVHDGASASYTGSTPTKTGVDNPNDYQFGGWSPQPANIHADTSCYAQFNFIGINETITDSWDQIIANVNNGTYKTKYSVGDTKKIDLGTEGVVAMQIVAMDTDDLANGSGKAPITWISEQLLATDHRMNPSYSSGVEGTGTLGGWEKSEMRTYLRDNIYPLVPTAIKNAIKPVTKYTRIYTASPESAVNDVATTETVWIPSRHEMFDGTMQYYETKGPRYSVAFPDNTSRIKKKPGASSAGWWWLRSANGSYTFYTVSNDGSNGSNNAYGTGGVVLGFCL